MKYKDLKKIIDKMNVKELEQEVVYNSENYCMSGPVEKIVKAKSDLYYTGEDDPAELYTKKQLKEVGYDNSDIECFEIEIPKGSFYVVI